MIDDILDGFAVEFMQDGNGNGSVGQCGEECDSPMSGVSSADGYLVPLLNTAILEDNMYFFYFARYIVELESDSLVVSQCILVPVLYNRFLDISIKTAK